MGDDTQSTQDNVQYVKSSVHWRATARRLDCSMERPVQPALLRQSARRQRTRIALDPPERARATGEAVFEQLWRGRYGRGGRRRFRWRRRRRVASQSYSSESNATISARPSADLRSSLSSL